MIDTTGGFDPRKLLQKSPDIGMETGGPGGMYGPPPGVSMQLSPPQTPISFQQSPPQVPIDMYRSDSPPPVSMQASPPQTPVSSSRSDTPTYTNPNIIPNVPPHQPIGGGVIPGISGNNTTVPDYTGNTGKSSADINAHLEQLRNNARVPELNYGYNPGQWGINKRIDDMAGKMDWSNNSYGLDANSWAKMQQGYIANLPDQAEYQAHQARLAQPYNESVASERAAGRPGHSGEVSQVPNYTAPAAMPTTLPQQQQLPIEQPQDRWLGTQRRQPTYF